MTRIRKQKTARNRIPESGLSGAALLKEQLCRFYDPQEIERIVSGSRARCGVTLRANTLRASHGDVARELSAAGLSFEPVGWYADAFLLPDADERSLWELPIYREGKVYLQSLSAMLPALVLNAQEGEDVLDMCAAPGGKTSQIAALSNGKAHITACELHAPRADKLRYNLGKLGVSHATVMQSDARLLDSFFSFDRILVDAPCTGSGTLDLSSESGISRAEKRFTESLLAKSRKSQRALLVKALGLLKPGGTCVYSTCSVLKCENEDIVEQALAAVSKSGSYEIEPIALPCSDILPLLPSSIEGCLSICPTEHYEGFFIASIVRS